MAGENYASGSRLWNRDGSVLFGPDGQVSATSTPGTAGRVYETHLESDVLIAASSPGTAPNTFPAGQPAVLLALPGIELRAGPVLVFASTSLFITNEDNATEDEPFVQLQVWIDGVQQPFSNATLAYQSDLPANLDAIEAFGGIQRRYVVAAGQHDVELRWGVQGNVPAVTAGVFALAGFDHASLVVTEV